MTEADFDPFHLSGNMLDGAEVTINSATFGTDAAYGDGGTLFIEFDLNVDGAEMSKRYNVGKAWSAEDNGRYATSDTKKYFTKTGGFGLFIDNAMLCGAKDILAERFKTTNPRGPMDSSLWDGLKFRLGTIEVQYGGEIGKKDVLVPVEFLGVVGGAKPAASTNGNGKVSPVLLAKLTTLAAESESYDSFVSQAFSVDGVDGNNAVEDIIMDQTDTGLFATAQA